MKLIIAEKPDMMRKIATALMGNKYTGEKVTIGKITMNLALHNNDIVVCCCSGHLYRYLMPKEIDEEYAKWSLNHLPLQLDTIPMVPTDEQFPKACLRMIKSYLDNPAINEVICACDADREGESIAREVIYGIKETSQKASKLFNSRTYSRMWYNEVTDEPLREAFKNRRPLEDYDNIYYSAKARQLGDYLVGINGTEAVTVKFGSFLNIGRVVTATLNMIVTLEDEIKNFKSKDFYKIIAHTDKDFDATYLIPNDNENRFYDKKMAENTIKKIGLGKAIVTKCEAKETKTNAPKLYSMTKLQADMNRKYGLTAHETLDIAQSLYEKGFTTYPRTEEECISESFAEKICDNLDGFPIFDDIVEIIKDNNYTLSSNVISKNQSEAGAHEAITPSTATINPSKFNTLTDVEKNVYKAILERFLENFFPPAVYDNLKVELDKDGYCFGTSFKALKSQGWMQVISSDMNNENIISLKKGDIVNIDELELVESKTVPPSRFTEASLIETMKNPTAYVVDKSDKDIIKEVNGIGTGATRDAIIESLKKTQYVKLDKKAIVPTEKGMTLIHNLPSDELKSVKLTADFEQKLKLIYQGKYDWNVFLKEIQKFVDQFIEKIKGCDSVKIENTNEREVLCTCPNCGSQIIENKLGYGCSNYKQCKVQIFSNALEKRFKKKTITKKQAIEMFTKGITSKKASGLVSKSGKEFEAYITYHFNKDAQYPNEINISFDKN